MEITFDPRGSLRDRMETPAFFSIGVTFSDPARPKEKANRLSPHSFLSRRRLRGKWGMLTFEISNLSARDRRK